MYAKSFAFFDRLHWLWCMRPVCKRTLMQPLEKNRRRVLALDDSHLDCALGIRRTERVTTRAWG